MSFLGRITYWRKHHELKERLRKMFVNEEQFSEEAFSDLLSEIRLLEPPSKRKLPICILKYKVRKISKKLGLTCTSEHLHEILYKVSKLDIGQVSYASSIDFRGALFDYLRKNIPIKTSDGIVIIERDNPFFDGLPFSSATLLDYFMNSPIFAFKHDPKKSFNWFATPKELIICSSQNLT